MTALDRCMSSDTAYSIGLLVRKVAAMSTEDGVSLRAVKALSTGATTAAA